MRILTVRQPWAWAIIHGGKDVENRVRNIAGNYRGPVAIHAGLTDADEPELWNRWVAWWEENGHPAGQRGHILGLVDLVDAHTVDDCLSTYGDLCSPWADGDTLSDLHLVLANPRPLTEPIPIKGALGLRALDDETTARVLADLTPTETNRTPS